MKADFLQYDGGTYQALLKVISFKDGWELKIREYVHEKKYDGEKPKIEEIAVYVLDTGLSMFRYLYTKKGVIER